MPMFVNEVKVIPKYGANNLLLTILPFFFIVAATNLAIPKINLHRIDVMSWLPFIVVVKKTLRYSNVFFYNRTIAYTAIP